MTFTMTIDGQPQPASGSFAVLNPATEDVVGQAPECSRDQLDAAVAAARRAAPEWRARPHSDRQDQPHGAEAANRH